MNNSSSPSVFSFAPSLMPPLPGGAVGWQLQSDTAPSFSSFLFTLSLPGRTHAGTSGLLSPGAAGESLLSGAIFSHFSTAEWAPFSLLSPQCCRAGAVFSSLSAVKAAPFSLLSPQLFRCFCHFFPQPSLPGRAFCTFLSTFT